MKWKDTLLQGESFDIPLKMGQTVWTYEYTDHLAPGCRCDKCGHAALNDRIYTYHPVRAMVSSLCLNQWNVAYGQMVDDIRISVSYSLRLLSPTGPRNTATVSYESAMPDAWIPLFATREESQAWCDDQNNKERKLTVLT